MAVATQCLNFVTTVHCLCRSARPFSPKKEAANAGLSPVMMPEEQEMAADDADGTDVLGTTGHSGPTGLAMIAAAAEHASPFSSELRVPLSRHVQHHLAGSCSTTTELGYMTVSAPYTPCKSCAD